MKPFKPPSWSLASASYAASRHGGAPPDVVRVELALPAETAARLERLFRARPGRGMDAMRPRYARHEAHVRAVVAQGGYPVLSGRRR
ncbi:hypothetical protein [Phenylobacterium sp.]|uniref:hypothetical protein n=1 Tax=Phenylobacterium sp. TaxID=1871053 RepID=UPI0035632B5D